MTAAAPQPGIDLASLRQGFDDAFGGFERVPVPRFHRTPVDARAAVPCAGHASIGAERLPVLDLLALAGRLDRTAVPT